MHLIPLSDGARGLGEALPPKQCCSGMAAIVVPRPFKPAVVDMSVINVRDKFLNVKRICVCPKRLFCWSDAQDANDGGEVSTWQHGTPPPRAATGAT